MGFFAVPDDWPVVYAAYRRAVRAEIAAIAGFVPHEDLTVQWDTASEVRDILAAFDTVKGVEQTQTGQMSIHPFVG